ncbi:hypothetical protein AB0C29_21700 [Actinoplanes sp. NPDC048791]|uniref:hypothetical protein n=1 Tax=Actinoplanes sp. NPDC048791 TaxID=3154623 RepID=UPI0033F17626
MGEAARYLVAPGEPDESITNGFVNPLDLFNYISPSAWVNDVIEKVSGIDIFGYATDAFTGEWAALYKFGDALNSLAQFLQEVGIEVQTSVNDVGRQRCGCGVQLLHERCHSRQRSTVGALRSGQGLSRSR